MTKRNNNGRIAAPQKPPLKLLIGIPSGTHWHRLFGLSLTMLVSELSSQAVNGYGSTLLKVDNHVGSILPRSREKLANMALAEDFSYLLFIDSDMVFPADVVHRLMSHQRMVIAANCATKTMPASTTARAKGATFAGTPVYSDSDKHGLEQVWRVGTGVMLINTQVFRRVRKPWFPIEYLPEIDDYSGEDWGFVKKLEGVGIPCYVDHDASRLIGHCGDFIYTHDYVGEVAQYEYQAVNA